MIKIGLNPQNMRRTWNSSSNHGNIWFGLILIDLIEANSCKRSNICAWHLWIPFELWTLDFGLWTLLSLHYNRVDGLDLSYRRRSYIKPLILVYLVLRYFSMHLILGSQVSSIVWNTEYKELVSGHGFSQNQLTVWKYPSLAKVNIKIIRFSSDFHF